MTTPIKVFQQQTIAGAPLDWSQTVPFNQFDPATGNLLDAVFTTAGTIDASASIENLAPVAATVNLDVGANIEAWVPAINESLALLTPLAVASVNLGAFQGTFNGTLDFGGPSGTVLPDMSASQTQTAAITPPGTGANSPLLGTGTFDVDVSTYSFSTIVGNGNLAVLLHGSAGAVLSLQYDATTPSGGSSDDAGDLAFFAWGGGPGSLISPININDVITTPQVVTLQSQTSGWTGTASFTQFNPTLGTLDEILLNVGNTLSGTFAAENLESSPAWVEMNENASMTVATPGDARGVIANAGTFYNPVELGAYDGSADFAGTSGESETIPVIPWWDVTSGATLTSGIDLRAFTGTGTIALPVTTAGTSTVSGPANSLTEITQQTGGTVSVSYVYTPFASTDSQSSAGVLGPFGLVAGSSHWDWAGTVGAHALNPPRMAFIGGLQGTTYLSAQPSETFVIGSGANGWINDFSMTGGDKLDLAGLLAGAPLAHDLSNLGSFLSVTGQTPGFISGSNTTLAVSGPGGAASLVLENSDSISVLGLLSGNALVLPAR